MSAERRDGRLFPYVGQTVPTIWERAGAVMEALRDDMGPAIAAQLLSTPFAVYPPAR